MLQILINNKDADLPDDISIAITLKSPVFYEAEASFAYNFNLSFTPRTPQIGGTLSVVVQISANTQYYDYTRTIGIISGATISGMTIGDFVVGSFRRTPTGADTYGGEILLKQVAAHVELNSNGSRQRYIK